jgi:hypothetical protein
MSYAMPAKVFKTTLGQRVEGAVAVGLAAAITLAVLAPLATGSHMSLARHAVFCLGAFAVTAPVRYVALTCLTVGVDRDGVFIVPAPLWSRSFVLWSDVSQIQTRKNFGRTVIRIVTTCGPAIRLPVPYSGLLLQRNAELSNDVQVLRQFMEESRHGHGKVG